ncbi:MAG: ABC transporter permease [Proteobacteria bacterium]|nr:ABC transporter permease [Pseudomonadota bacterium]
MSARPTTMPLWIDIGLLPLLNIGAAFVIAGMIIAAIGENPLTAMSVMAKGAFVYQSSLGYTLFYATNFIFAGLAVAIAFHGGLFNIGAEGQAMLGGLGIACLALVLDSRISPLVVVVLAVPMAALFGAIWGAIPGWLQARRGSHIVITTIMFNFIAASLLVWLLAGSLMEEGQMSPQTRSFASGVWLVPMHILLENFGLDLAPSPLNFSFIIAILMLVLIWLLIWRTRFGYMLRAVGHSQHAARTSGIDLAQVTMITMAISGGLAGLMAINEVLGNQHRLLVNFTSGYGFTGIAVALMGRGHPFGIFLASLLFGALYQGGAELDFEFQSINREMVLLIQGLIILFSGALSMLFAPLVMTAMTAIASNQKRKAGHV